MREKNSQPVFLSFFESCLFLSCLNCCCSSSIAEIQNDKEPTEAKTLFALDVIKHVGDYDPQQPAESNTSTGDDASLENNDGIAKLRQFIQENVPEASSKGRVKVPLDEGDYVWTGHSTLRNDQSTFATPTVSASPSGAVYDSSAKELDEQIQHLQESVFKGQFPGSPIPEKNLPRGSVDVFRGQFSREINDAKRTSADSANRVESVPSEDKSSTKVSRQNSFVEIKGHPTDPDSQSSHSHETPAESAPENTQAELETFEKPLTPTPAYVAKEGGVELNEKALLNFLNSKSEESKAFFEKHCIPKKQGIVYYAISLPVPDFLTSFSSDFFSLSRAPQGTYNEAENTMTYNMSVTEDIAQLLIRLGRDNKKYSFSPNENGSFSIVVNDVYSPDSGLLLKNIGYCTDTLCHTRNNNAVLLTPKLTEASIAKIKEEIMKIGEEDKKYQENECFSIVWDNIFKARNEIQEAQPTNDTKKLQAAQKKLAFAQGTFNQYLDHYVPSASRKKNYISPEQKYKKSVEPFYQEIINICAGDSLHLLSVSRTDQIFSETERESLKTQQVVKCLAAMEYSMIKVEDTFSLVDKAGSSLSKCKTKEERGLIVLSKDEQGKFTSAIVTPFDEYLFSSDNPNNKKPEIGASEFQQLIGYHVQPTAPAEHNKMNHLDLIKQKTLLNKVVDKFSNKSPTIDNIKNSVNRFNEEVYHPPVAQQESEKAKESSFLSRFTKRLGAATSSIVKSQAQRFQSYLVPYISVVQYCFEL